MISLDKCNGSCNNAVDDFSAKVCVPTKTKGVNVKVFNIITRINEAKRSPMLCKCTFDSIACSSDQKWNNETCQCECKNY